MLKRINDRLPDLLGNLGLALCWAYLTVVAVVGIVALGEYFSLATILYLLLLPLVGMVLILTGYAIEQYRFKKRLRALADHMRAVNERLRNDTEDIRRERERRLRESEMRLMAYDDRLQHRAKQLRAGRIELKGQVSPYEHD